MLITRVEPSRPTTSSQAQQERTQSNMNASCSIVYDINTRQAELEAPFDTNKYRKDSKERLVLKTMNMNDIRSLSGRPWLINQVLLDTTVSLIYGESGIGKSFLALHFAYCVAYGLEWFGRSVEQGNVLYIYAESPEGLKDRQAAWTKYYDMPDIDAIQFYGFPIHLIEDKSLLLDTIKSMEEEGTTFKLIVIDTLTNCTDGLDQKDQREVAHVLSAAHEIKEASKAHVMLIHHSNKEGNYNGSKAFKNHVDTMMEFKKDGIGPLVLHCEKQRDKKMFEDIRLDSKEVELDYDESTQEYNTSWVLVAHKRVHIVSSHAGDEQQSVPDKMWDILSALGQVSYTTWEKACREFVKGTAFYGHSKTLIEQGRVLKTGKGKSIRYEAVV